MTATSSHSFRLPHGVVNMSISIRFDNPNQLPMMLMMVICHRPFDDLIDLKSTLSSISILPTFWDCDVITNSRKI